MIASRVLLGMQFACISIYCNTLPCEFVGRWKIDYALLSTNIEAMNIATFEKENLKEDLLNPTISPEAIIKSNGRRYLVTSETSYYETLELHMEINGYYIFKHNHHGGIVWFSKNIIVNGVWYSRRVNKDDHRPEIPFYPAAPFVRIEPNTNISNKSVEETPRSYVPHF